MVHSLPYADWFRTVKLTPESLSIEMLFEFAARTLIAYQSNRKRLHKEKQKTKRLRPLGKTKNPRAY